MKKNVINLLQNDMTSVDFINLKQKVNQNGLDFENCHCHTILVNSHEFYLTGKGQTNLKSHNRKHAMLAHTIVQLSLRLPVNKDKSWRINANARETIGAIL